MTNDMIMPFVPNLDLMGFDWINLVGGAVFDVCVRYLHEDPWERIRLVAGALNRTPVDVMTRGQSLFTFRFFADEVVELAIRRVAANGARRVTVYDALNDARNLQLSVAVGRSVGLHVCAGLVYSVSPVHTDGYYQGVAQQLIDLGADSVLIKDPSGLLTPDRVRTLVPALKSVTGEVPLELHSHSLSGLAEPCYLEAVPLGVDTIHTAIDPLASGASLPPVGYCVRHLRKVGFECRPRLDDLDEMADYFRSVARRHGLPLAVPHRYDPDLYRHQVPGGMISNLRSDLTRMGLRDRESQIMDEVEQVRIDLGYPILVSPFAQFIVTQAMLNVLGGERYSTIPIEVRRYLLGHYGRIIGPILPALMDRVLAEAPRGTEPFAGRPGELIDPPLTRLRAERGPFRSDDDLLLAAFYADAELAGLRARGPWAPTDAAGGRRTTPLLRLLTDLAQAEDVRDVRVQRPGLRLAMRR